MTQRLIISSETKFDDIKNFFSDIGPDARVRARKGSDQSSVELYIRDMSLKGRLIEWWNTNSEERKNSYKVASQAIADIISLNAKPEESNHYISIFQRHKQDFVAYEINSLQRQFEAKRRIDEGINSVFPRKEIVPSPREEMIVERKDKDAPRSSETQEKYDKMVKIFKKINSKVIVKALMGIADSIIGTGEKFDIDKLRRGYDELLKFIELDYSKRNSNDENVEVDFLAIENFLKFIKKLSNEIDTLTNAPGGVEAQKPHINRDKYNHDYRTVGGNRWYALRQLAAATFKTEGDSLSE